SASSARYRSARGTDFRGINFAAEHPRARSAISGVGRSRCDVRIPPLRDAVPSNRIVGRPDLGALPRCFGRVTTATACAQQTINFHIDMNKQILVLIAAAMTLA